jgi:hypothetical protein
MVVAQFIIRRKDSGKRPAQNWVMAAGLFQWKIWIGAWGWNMVAGWHILVFYTTSPMRKGTAKTRGRGRATLAKKGY